MSNGSYSTFSQEIFERIWRNKRFLLKILDLEIFELYSDINPNNPNNQNEVQQRDAYIKRSVIKSFVVELCIQAGNAGNAGQY